jgi:hypothetical protein
MSRRCRATTSGPVGARRQLRAGGRRGAFGTDGQRQPLASGDRRCCLEHVPTFELYQGLPGVNCLTSQSVQRGVTASSRIRTHPRVPGRPGPVDVGPALDLATQVRHPRAVTPRRAVILCINQSTVADRARERLYVGLSRAADQLIVVGDPDVVTRMGGTEVARRVGIS